MADFKEKCAEFGELLKLEHSLFALPFAFIGTFMAADGFPSLKVTLLVVLCMVFARTAGMSFNRVLDANIDRDNPRTADRAVAAGRVSKLSVWALALLCLAGLSLCAYFLNPLAFYLSPLCHLMLFAYSLMKRFTWACHVFLGLVEAFAPIGGWIAVTGTCDEWTPVLLGIATTTWIAGMDIVYATQDADYDRERGLHSIPAKFGLKKSFHWARLLHVITLVLLVLAGMSHGTAWPYAVGLVVVAWLFSYQHRLVSPEKTEKLNFAFFGVNSWIAVTLMVATYLDTLIH